MESSLTLVLLGGILLISLYHSVLFFFWKKEQGPIFFAIYSLIIAVEQISRIYYFNNLDIYQDIKLTYISFALSFPFFILFIYEFLQIDLKKYYIILSFNLAVIVIPVVIFKFEFVFLIYEIIILAFITTVFIRLFKAIKEKKKGATLLFFGTVILLATVILRSYILKFEIDINTLRLLCLFAFIFIKSVLIAQRFSFSFIKSEVLAQELYSQNKSLEDLVEIRTEELKNANNELVLQKDELDSLYQELKYNNEQINSAINYAKTIQSATLPDKELLDKNFENFLIYLPKDVVSGDFYWFHNIEREDKIKSRLISVADCSGHGVPGAFMSMISIQLLNEIVIGMSIYSPVEILEKLNKNVRKALRQDKTDNRDGLDMCLFRIDEENEDVRITYSGAKLPLFRYNSKTEVVEKIDATRKSIGGYPSKKVFKYDEYKFSVNKNDILYLTSDGYIDQNNLKRKRFGTQKLMNLIKENYNKDINIQRKIFLDEFEKHKSGVNQRDDITIIALKI